MKTFIVIIALVLFASLGDSKRHPRYKQHMIKFNKDYSNRTEEFKARREKNFFNNLAVIERFNNRTGRFKDIKPGMQLRPNHLSDRDPANFTRDYCGTIVPPTARALPQDVLILDINAPVKASVDYRHYFQPIRDQGRCGSCWAYSCASLAEAHITKHTGARLMLSRQSLVDCSPVDKGCDGGWPGSTISWIIQSGNKLPLEADYAYTSSNDISKKQCRLLTSKKIPVNIGSFFTQPVKSEDFMKKIVSSHGPVGIAMYVGENAIFQNYGGGIHYDPDAPSGYDKCPEANHAMVIVGYGSEGPGKDYWIVRNSWGEDWGEKGYIRMARNRNNNALVAC